MESLTSNQGHIYLRAAPGTCPKDNFLKKLIRKLRESRRRKEEQYCKQGRDFGRL